MTPPSSAAAEQTRLEALGVPVRFHGSIRSVLRKGSQTKPSEWVTFDITMAISSMLIGYMVSPKYHMTYSTSELLGMAAFTVGILVGGNIMDLYRRQVFFSGSRLVMRLAFTALIGVLSLIMFFQLFLYVPVGRWIILTAALVFFFLALLPRAAMSVAARMFKIKILYVGDSESSLLVEQFKSGVRYHELTAMCGDSVGGDHIGVDQLHRFVEDYKIDKIVIAPEYLNHRNVLKQCFRAVESGCVVVDETTFYEEIFEQVPVDHIDDTWFHTSGIGVCHTSASFFKRVIDIVLSSICLLICAPLFLGVYLLIRLTSPGPAIYRQVRCGQFNRTFTMYKFRTMCLDAESDGQAVWASEQDPRVTRIGRFLRKTRIDEMPQFVNVLKGDMSFVGPRPERPEFVETIEQTVPYFAFRHWLRPGITGLAQIRFRYSSSVEDGRKKLQYDLYYIKHLTILFDLQIMLRTIVSLMRGAR